MCYIFFHVYTIHTPTIVLPCLSDFIISNCSLIPDYLWYHHSEKWFCYWLMRIWWYHPNCAGKWIIWDFTALKKIAIDSSEIALYYSLVFHKKLLLVHIGIICMIFIWVLSIIIISFNIFFVTLFTISCFIFKLYLCIYGTQTLPN